MRNLIILIAGMLMVLASSCSDTPCDTSACKFKKGDDVTIKHKTFHDKATVTEVGCGCTYTISYYSYLGVRRHRVVEEVEIEK